MGKRLLLQLSLWSHHCVYALRSHLHCRCDHLLRQEASKKVAVEAEGTHALAVTDLGLKRSARSVQRANNTSGGVKSKRFTLLKPNAMNRPKKSGTDRRNTTDSQKISVTSLRADTIK